MKCSIKETLSNATRILYMRDRPRLEAEILLCFVLGVDRVFLHTYHDKILSQEEIERFQALILRAKNNEPIEYLTRNVSFYGYEWQIDQGVLIPRPETEILIESVAKIIQDHGIKKIFEFGIGSGVISITLALLYPHILITASDINPLAIELTKKNIKRFLSLDPTLSDRIHLIQGDVLKENSEFENFDLLVSNPPYIACSYKLPPNVEYEPKDALFGGKEGDEILRALIDFAKRKSIPWIACEMGFDQKNKMLNKLKESKCKKMSFYTDLSGLDRGFIAEL